MRSSLRSCASCGNSHNEHLLTNKLIKKLRSEARCVAKLHTELVEQQQLIWSLGLRLLLSV